MSLVVVVALSWCAGTGRWTAEAWNTPLQYLDGYYTDVLTTLTGLNGAVGGSVMSFWKINPDLGAPFDGNWTDWPSNEELLGVISGTLAKAFGLFAGLNAALLTCHLLAAAVFFLVARRRGCSDTWAFVSALAYGLAPFVFTQSPHHMGVASVWHVPLFVLVWDWASKEENLNSDKRATMAAMAIGALAGAMNIYYANILCQITLLGAATASLRTRSWAPMKRAGAVVAAVAAVFAVMNLDTWTYSAVHGRNPGSFSREYRWLEIYGLKLVDLFVPPATHHIQPFADFATRHREEVVLQDEGSYLGLVGIAALGWLAIRFAAQAIRRPVASPPAEGWQVLWIVLYGSTGGLNAILGAAGITLFRTGCRYSIIILAISLLAAAKRLTELEHERGQTSPGDPRRTSALAAALLVALVFLDQVPRAPAAEDIQTIAAQVAADRDFVERMEAALPPRAMVFQLPVMDFPEAPVPGISSYDHLRPYLYSTSLRFSFGSTKGRPRERWQHELSDLSLEERVRQLKLRGFRAIYLNRNGFSDGGAQVIEGLRGLGLEKPLIEHKMGDLVCILLE